VFSREYGFTIALASLAARTDVADMTADQELSTHAPATHHVYGDRVVGATHLSEAGNISKRQSATAFHFSRAGGNCPMWVVHHAFSTPGQFVTQVAQMPDGRSYFWVARTTSTNPSRYLEPHKTFAIGLGCDLAHANKLVYSAGVDLIDPDAAVPIGAGCKICDRPACPQRAFPYVGAPVHVDLNTRSDLPYPPNLGNNDERA
jgi:predicted transcriptional regulator